MTKERAEELTFDLTAVHINAMAQVVHENAKDKGFYDNEETNIQFAARATANLHGEVSELWEAFRRGEDNAPCDKAKEMFNQHLSPLTCAQEELADIIIRAMDTAAYLGINIGRAVVTKHKFNKTRSTRHGGKKA